MKITTAELLIQLIFIALCAWFIISGFSIEAQEIEIINDVETLIITRNGSLIIQLSFCIGIAVLMSYFNIYFLFKNYKKLSHYRTLFISLSLVIGSILICSYLPQHIPEEKLLLPISLSLGIPVFFYTLTVAYSISKIWMFTEKASQQLLIDKKQAELNLLRNQLQPHFLFNALNNLLALVDQKKSPLLATSFDRLSQLLRYVIDENRADKTTIDKENEFIQHYAALQLLRFEPEEVNFQLEILGDHKEQAIEPGLFIPFVENAFKYGTEPESTAKIIITFDISNPEEVIFKIKNKIFDTHKNHDSTGTGIPSTKKRLYLIYPDKHNLKIEANEYFYVELKISTV